jgi:copper chaperone
METTQIQITGMTCEHCVSAVTRALQATPGVDMVQVRLVPGQATVSGSADVALLLKAIEDEGYRAAVASA